MSTGVRNYGGWRERRGFGIGSLTGGQTLLGLVAVVLALGVVLVVPAALPLLALPAGVAVAAVAVRVRGESLVAMVTRHARWRVRLRSGGTRYRASAQSGLPGALSGITMLADGDGAMLLDGDRRTVTAVLEVEPEGLEFADGAEVEQWVQGWGRWLAHLGYVPDVDHVAVTVFTRPLPTGPAQPLPGGVEGMVQEIAAVEGVEQQSRTLISITLDTAGQDTEQAAGHLREAVASLRGLDRCGMTVLPALGRAEIVEWVRACYEPALESGTASEQWRDARPTALEEHWGAYRHDGSWSVAFAWDECPGESIGPQPLAGLLSPAWYPKRVVMVFRPVPAHTAAREVDRQAEAAAFRSQYRRRLGRDETARERLDVERARQTAQEQARGSGLVDVGVYAVATAADEDALQRAAADLHNRAGQARIRLRRAYGDQGAVFTASLGLGCLPGRGR